MYFFQNETAWLFLSQPASIHYCGCFEDNSTRKYIQWKSPILKPSKHNFVN
jgi:hypothetical protein